MNWTARSIGTYMARQFFQNRHLVIVPNCSWPGSECDLLVVTTDLRVIDIEIKISRSDFRADAKKDKWFHAWDYWKDGPVDPARRKPKDWPSRVWKHYFCLPQHIWTPNLLPASSKSGVLLLQDRFVHVERRAKPCRDADRLTPAQVLDIARLANIRMWHALDGLAMLQRASRKA